MTEQADILEAVIPTKTDKEVIHPSQFVNRPLLLEEARFLLLSPEKPLRSLHSNQLAAADTPISKASRLAVTQPYWLACTSCALFLQ